MVQMSHNHAAISNASPANSSVKTTNALIQLKFVMVKISAVTIRRKVPIAIDLFALINT